jgi:hypothetical protein
MTPMSTFDPMKHIMQIKGKDYLETKWRLVWLRDTHPDASVQTELVRADERGVTIRADVSWPVIINETLHIVHNTGYAMELWDKPGRIGAALENAETSALGRALAAAGFGTQFAPELDFDTHGDRVVDGPVQRPQAATRPDTRRPSVQPQHIQQDAPTAIQTRQQDVDDVTQPALSSQVTQLFDLGRDLNIYVKKYVKDEFGGREVNSLTYAEAQLLIEQWQTEAAELAGVS